MKKKLFLSSACLLVGAVAMTCAALGAAPAGGRGGRGGGAGGGAGGPSPDLDFPARALAAAKEANLPKEVLLWENGAPNAKGDSEEDKPAFYPFLPPKEKSTGAAVIISPGGGFTHRAADYEGITFAKWFNEKGIAAFLLR